MAQLRKLIGCVKLHPELYDPDHGKFKNSDYKDDIWDDIALECDYDDVGRAKQEWEVLQENYRNYIQKSDSYSTIKKFKFHDLMSFMECYLDSRQTTTVANDFNENPEGNNHTNFEARELVENESSKLFDSQEESSEDYEPCSKARKKNPIENKLLQMTEQIQTTTNKKERQTTQKTQLRTDKPVRPANATSKSSLQNFFMSMYETTLGFPAHIQTKIKRDIFNLITENEERLYSSTDSTSFTQNKMESEEEILCPSEDSLDKLNDPSIEEESLRPQTESSGLVLNEPLFEEERMCSPNNSSSSILNEPETEKFQAYTENMRFKKQRAWWPPADEVALIKVWRQNFDELRSHKRNGHVYNNMFKQMGGRYTTDEISNKIANLTQLYRRSLKDLETSGESSSKWKYFSAIHNMMTNECPSNDSSTVEGNEAENVEGNNQSSSFLSDHHFGQTNSDYFSPSSMKAIVRRCTFNTSCKANMRFKKKRIWWPPADEIVLLKVWRENLSDLRKHKRNGHIYNNICKQMGGKYSTEEIYNKIENLSHTYRKSLKEMETSGESSSKWKHFSAIHKMMTEECPSNDSSAVAGNEAGNEEEDKKPSFLSDIHFEQTNTDHRSSSSASTRAITRRFESSTFNSSCPIDDHRQKKRIWWPPADELALLEVWRQHFGDLRCNPRKRPIYHKMAKQMGSRVTAAEIHTKICNLRHHYNKALKDMEAAGQSTSNYKYFSIIHDMMTAEWPAIDGSSVSENAGAENSLQFADIPELTDTDSCSSASKMKDTSRSDLSIFNAPVLARFTRKRAFWSHAEEKVLLKLWQENIEDLRKLKRNSHIYRAIARQLGGKFTTDEVHMKITNLGATYRKELRDMKASGRSSSKWRLFKTVHKIMTDEGTSQDTRTSSVDQNNRTEFTDELEQIGADSSSSTSAMATIAGSESPTFHVFVKTEEDEDGKYSVSSTDNSNMDTAILP